MSNEMDIIHKETQREEVNKIIVKTVISMQFNYEKIMDRHINYWKRLTIKNRMIMIYFKIIKESTDQNLIKKYFYKHVRKFSKCKY